MLFAVLSARSDDGSGTNAFCERARSEFNGLIRQCKGERAAYWQQRYVDQFDKYIAKSNELSKTSDMLGHEPNGKLLQQVFAYDYLNTVNELQLDEATRLVEELGRELVMDRVSTQLSPALREIDTQFAAMEGKPQSDSLQRSYIAFLELKRQVAHLESEAPVKESFTFEPKASAFASNPIKSVVYTIHDWNAALAKIDDLKRQLQPIQDSLQTARLFSPKDPIPWLPVVTQITFLMVAMAGWIKSYHDEKALLTIGVLVVSSMILSVFLVFYSRETLMNILCQSFVPGGFILYWLAKNKGWIGRHS